MNNRSSYRVLCEALLVALLLLPCGVSQAEDESKPPPCPLTSETLSWTVQSKPIPKPGPNNTDAKWLSATNLQMPAAPLPPSALNLADAVVTTGSTGLTTGAALQDLYSVISSTAKAELERYAVQFMEGELCGSNAAAYFPNTCAVKVSLDQPYLSSIDPLAALRRPLESDVRDLPACIIQQRTTAPPTGSSTAWSSSHFGYLLTDLFSQLNRLSGADWSLDKGAGALLYGFATSPALAQDCVYTADSVHPHSLGFACTTLSSMELIRTVLELKEGQKSGSVISDAGNLDTIVVAVLGQWRDVMTADCSQEDLHCSEAAEAVADLVSKALQDSAKTSAYRRKAATFLASIDALQADWRTLSGAMATTDNNRQNSTSGSVDTGQLTDAVAKFALDLEITYKTAICLSPYKLGRDGMQDCSASSTTDPEFSAWDAVTTGMIATYADIVQRHYQDAVTQVFTLIGCASTNTSHTATDIGAQCTTVLGRAGTATGYLRTLGLAADIASSKTSADAKSILEQWDTTLGRYDIKEKGAVWSVGALFGVQYGQEALTATDVSKSGQFYGLYVPVGVEFSHPWGHFWKTDHYLGAGIKVIDIGNLASTSTSSSTDAGARTAISSVLAPGLFAYYSLLGPVVVGLDYDFYTRSLRQESRPNGQTVSLSRKHSFAFFVGIDVPLMIFGY